jgi:putative membrane protein
VDQNAKIDRLNISLITTLAIVFVWSVIGPYDMFTWVLEMAPIPLGLIVLAATYRRFRLTGLAYILIWIHALILLVGAHYTYAEVPLFDWIRDTFDLSRNHYDRLGHLAQGFIPAILAREVLLRISPLKKGKWLFFIVVCVCLSISACYEIIEWLVAATTGTAAEAFLGTQGDPWDTQTDMALALIGAIISQLVLARLHDKLLGKLSEKHQAN